MAGEVPGASTGVYSETSAKHQEYSSEVKSKLKRKSSDPNPDRGIHFKSIAEDDYVKIIGLNHTTFRTFNLCFLAMISLQHTGI